MQRSVTVEDIDHVPLSLCQLAHLKTIHLSLVLIEPLTFYVCDLFS